MSETASALFPDALSLLFTSLDVSRTEATDIETAFSGREVRRARFPFGGYRMFKMQSVPLDQGQAQSLRDFMRARQGRLQAFWFFPPDKESYSSEDLGTYTGLVASGGPYDILAKSGTYSAVTVGSDHLAVAYSASTGTGTNGNDQLTFTAVDTPTLSDGGGSGALSAGNYQVIFTAVTSGVERLILASNHLSGISAVQTLAASHKLGLASIPLGLAGTTARREWRTKAGGSTFYLANTISDNVTTTLTDNTPDSSLTVQLSTTEIINITGTARAQVLVRSDLDNYQHSLMQDTGFHTIWQLQFKEVR